MWAVSAKSLLSALNGGRDPAEFATFLAGRADTGLPGTVVTLFDDVARRAGRLTDPGYARVIECADPAVAALIANDRALRGLCRPMRERHLAVSPAAESRFRTGLRRLGYVMPGPPPDRANSSHPGGKSPRPFPQGENCS